MLQSLFKLLPLMYLFELQDILFAVKSIKTPTDQFCITSSVSTNTRSGTCNKLMYPRHLDTTSRHCYFHRLSSLWNALPIIDLNLSFTTIRYKLKSYLWNHFLSNFDDNINCSFHFLCPCSRYHLIKECHCNICLAAGAYCQQTFGALAIKLKFFFFLWCGHFPHVASYF